VDHPIVIKGSLILSDVHISSDQNIERMLLTPDVSIQCSGNAGKEPPHGGNV